MLARQVVRRRRQICHFHHRSPNEC
jgi:hypothetical protein